MNAKVVFIVELKAKNRFYFYCLLQINNNLSLLILHFYITKIETDFKYTTLFQKKNRILTVVVS